MALLGAKVAPWVIETDRTGSVLSFFDEMVLQPEIDRDPTTWSGRGGPFAVSASYDEEGRITALQRAVKASGELYIEESVTYRDDGGIASHRLTTGPAYLRFMSSELELVEERRVEADVELISELRKKRWPASGAQTAERRWTERGPDGNVREFVDESDDGTVDRVIERVRVERSLTETLFAADGSTKRAQQTTQFDSTSRPIDRSRDNDGDGVIDLRVSWTDYGARRKGTVVRMAAGSSTDVWERADAEQATDAEGLLTETVEGDEWGDGERDYVTLKKTFRGQPLKLASASKSATVVLMGYELERSCPNVVPRIAMPPFRTRCPFTRRFQSCDLQASWDEPGEAGF